jgi:hypothetical protein
MSVLRDLTPDEFKAALKKRALAETSPAAMLTSALADMKLRPDLYSQVQYEAIGTVGMLCWAGSVAEMTRFIEGF